MKKYSISIVIIILISVLPAIMSARENTSKRYIEDLLVEKGLERKHIKKNAV